MSTYSDASLIFYPSGYKESKLYSLKPTDGSGDLTFTRASSATRVNEQGLIETASILGSEEVVNGNFATDTNWDLGSATISGGLLNLLGGGGLSYALQTNTNLVIGKRYLATYTIVSISNAGLGVRVRVGNGGNGIYRTTTGTFTEIITCAGSFEIFLEGNSTNFIGSIDNVSVKEVITNNIPRIDYTGGGCGKLLLEPQRTNLLLQSEDISSASWTKGNSPTITTNIATAPDGTVSAGGIQDTTGGTFKRIRQSTSVSANSTNTASVFVKKETIQTNFGGLALTYTGSTAKFAYAIINPVDGTIVVSSDSVIGATSTKAEDYGNWWRFSLTATDNGGNTNLEIAYYATISTNGTSTGVGIGSVRTIWGFQLEIGATYATSYIPTYGASSTRSQDSCGKTGISSLIGQTEGTIYIETTPLNDVTTYTERLIKFEDGGSDLIGVNRYSNSFLNYYGVNSGSTQWSINVADVFEGSQKTKIACAYKENDIVIYVDGVQKGTDTSASIPTTDRMYFANDASGGLTYIGKHTQAFLFPTRLTNDQLEELTK